MKLVVLIIVCVLILIPVVIIYYGASAAQRKPNNCPAQYLAGKKSVQANKVVVCVGNSITHGRVSANYVDLIGERLGDDYQLINAGVNSELSWNVLQRLDEIIDCQPDFITILIGTNDANATLNEKNCKVSIKKMNLPQKPTAEWFRENLVEICQRLKLSTNAKIALLSLPPIGEDQSHVAYQRTADYSRIIKEITSASDISYLPLHEKMTAYLDQNNQPPRLRDADGFRPVMYKGIFKHYILGQSFNEIATANGFQLLTDFLHLNTTGSELIAELIVDFVVAN